MKRLTQLQAVSVIGAAFLMGAMPGKDKAEMADEPTPNPEPTDPVDPPEPNDPAPTPDLASLQAELEAARKALKSVNRESADRRKRLEELEKAEEERKAAQMSELDKANKRAEEAEQAAKDAALKAQDTLIHAAFVSEAAKVGAKYPEDAFALADRSGVEIAEDGKVTGVAEAVKALVDGGRLPMGTKPAPDLNGGAGSGDRSNDKTPKPTMEEIAMAKKLGVEPDAYIKNKVASRTAQDEKQAEIDRLRERLSALEQT